MNTIDKVISIPMLIMCVTASVANFQNGNICWGNQHGTLLCLVDIHDLQALHLKEAVNGLQWVSVAKPKKL